MEGKGKAIGQCGNYVRNAGTGEGLKSSAARVCGVGELRTLTPPPSGTPLKIRGDHRYARFSAINNCVEALNN